MEGGHRLRLKKETRGADKAPAHTQQESHCDLNSSNKPPQAQGLLQGGREAGEGKGEKAETPGHVISSKVTV